MNKPYLEIHSGEKHIIGEYFTPCIETIAKSLAYTNRFNGRAGNYSVAAHSMFVANLLPDELKLAGLLHDAHECYIGDMPSPLKKLVPEYVKLESFYQNVIADYYNVDTQHPDVIKADMTALYAESKVFKMPLISESMKRIGCEYRNENFGYTSISHPQPPQQVYNHFLHTFRILTGE